MGGIIPGTVPRIIPTLFVADVRVVSENGRGQGAGGISCRSAGRPTGTQRLWVAYYQIGFPNGPKKWQCSRWGYFWHGSRTHTAPEVCASETHTFTDFSVS